MDPNSNCSQMLKQRLRQKTIKSNEGILHLSPSAKGYLPSHILFPILELGCCLLIISRISYTEIDWTSYMEQVEGFLGGERNYLNLKGSDASSVLKESESVLKESDILPRYVAFSE